MKTNTIETANNIEEIKTFAQTFESFNWFADRGAHFASKQDAVEFAECINSTFHKNPTTNNFFVPIY